ncbi:hypothetical protein D3C84_825460 [compost metagenome]
MCQGLLRRTVISALFGQLGCLCGPQGTQASAAAHFGLLGRGQGVEQAQGFIGLTGLRQHIDQALNGLRVTALHIQHLAIVGLRGVQLAGLGLNVGQGQARIDAVRVQAHGLGDAGLRLGRLRPRLVAGLLQQRPITHAVQRRLPACAAIGDGPVEQLLGFAETALLLTHHAEATQGISVVGFAFQASGEGLFGSGLIAFLQRL